jgi:F-type H+-transporting ATPase subunit b
VISIAHAQDIERQVDTLITEEAAHKLAFWQEPETWLAVAFLIFIGLLARPVWRRATTTLDARAAQIETDLEEARKLREEAQATLASYQRKQRDAAREAEQIIAHAEESAKRITADAEVALKDMLKRREALTVEKIAQAQAKAVSEVKAEAVEIALAATERLLRERIDEAKSDQLVEAAIKDIPARLQ